jgi:hypothetical protein
MNWQRPGWATACSGISRSDQMNLFRNSPDFTFTRLHARITEDDGAFTVNIRMINHLKPEERAWGQEIVATIDVASSMIESVAKEFGIRQKYISIKIVMSNFKDGTLH